MSRYVGIQPPWGNLLGVARSFIYLSLAMTLLVSPPWVTTTPLLGVEPQYGCEDLRAVALYCLVDPSEVALAQFVSGAFMLIAAAGLLPAVFALPAAYVAFSVAFGTSLPDGGDQIAAVLLILLLPNTLLDFRISHWHVKMASHGNKWTQISVAVASMSLFIARLQISAIYFFAGVEKLSSSSWVDGSAVYAWLRHMSFGAPEWLSPVLLPLTERALISSAITWGTLVLEITLGISLLLPESIRIKLLLPVGFIFHLGIMFAMGIASFAVVMLGALIILLTSPGVCVLALDRIQHNGVSMRPSRTRIET